MVEFAMVFPMAVLLTLGILSSAWLSFQNASLSDGARNGVRAASIESLTNTSYVGTGLDANVAGCGAQGGEAANPDKIVAAVTHAADQLQVNQAQLCATGDSCAGGCHGCWNGGTPNKLVQSAPPSTSIAVITVTVPAGQNLCNATNVTVTLARQGRGLAPPLSGVFNMSAQSEMPVQP